jgi:hypothetical protein
VEPVSARLSGARSSLEVSHCHRTSLNRPRPLQPVFSESEWLALVGYLAGYRSLTRESYALDLRQFPVWCHSRSLALFSVRRADIETFARELEVRVGKSHRRPAAHVRHRDSTEVACRRSGP